MIIGPVVLDEWRDWWDVAGVHGWNAGGAAHRRSLVVQVQHTDGNNSTKRKESSLNS